MTRLEDIIGGLRSVRILELLPGEIDQGSKWIPLSSERSVRQIADGSKVSNGDSTISHQQNVPGRQVAVHHSRLVNRARPG